MIEKQNIYGKYQPASLTKIMTFWMVLKEIEKEPAILNEKV